VQDHVAADGQQDGLAEDAEQLGAGPVDGVDLRGVVVGVAVLADDVAVVEDVVPLPVVRGDDPDAVEALGEVGEDVGGRGCSRARTPAGTRGTRRRAAGRR
jgi:hypothetical protein